MNGYEKLIDSLGDPERKTLSDIMGGQTAISFEAQDNGVMVNVTGFAGAKALIKDASNECGHYAEVLYYEQLIEMLASLHEDLTDRLARSRRRFLASECGQRDALRKGRRSRRDGGNDLPPELQALIDSLRGPGVGLQVVEVSRDRAGHILDGGFANLLKEVNEQRRRDVKSERDEKPDEVDETFDRLHPGLADKTLNDFEADIPEQRKSED